MIFGAEGRIKAVGGVGQEKADELLKKAVDEGVNFIDSANVYSEGIFREITGQAIKNSGISCDSVVFEIRIMKRFFKRRSPFPSQRSGPGYKVLFAVTALTIPSGFLADWNRTHLFNPRWTPHSKFHDAITILLAAFLGIGGLYYLTRSRKKNEELEMAVLLPTLFWTSMLLAFVFPGTSGLEAEFPDKVPKVGPWWINEAPVSLLILSLLAAGYVAEKRDMNSITLPDSGSNL